jgi:hypothetical protein
MTVSSRDVKVQPDAGRELTLGDLREFIAALELAGAADSTPVRGTVTWRGKLSDLHATAIRLGDSASVVSDIAAQR